MKKLSRYSKLLGLLAAGAMTGCVTSETSVLTSRPAASASGSAIAASSFAPAGSAAAASEQASAGPISRMGTAVGESAVGKGVKAMFTSNSSSTVNRVPALPSVTKESKPPKATPDFHVAMAQQMESIGNLAGAEAQYHKALELDKQHLVALINLAHLCDRQKRMSEAEGLYLKATKLHPREAAAFNDLGLCYARQHKLAQSQAALSEAVKLDGERKLYRNNLATVLVEIDRPQEALQHLQAVHDEPTAHYNLGYLLANKGDQQLAEQHFRQALRLNPALTAAQTWLDNLHGQPSTLAAAPAEDANATDSLSGPVAIANPSEASASRMHRPAETLTELPAAGPHLHSGIHKLPPVDEVSPPPSRY